jgi:dephospho-CoA kinase
MPLIIGLTGGIGSGKSSVAALFAKHGAEIIDTDDIAHQLTRPESPVLTSIREQFGDSVFLPDGQLNRAKMRERVFSDPVAKKNLESLLHPLIRQEVVDRLAHARGFYVLIVVPLLLETTSYRELVDRILVVDCDGANQLARTMARSHLGEAEVSAIMTNQLPRKQRLTQADDIINNNGGAASLTRQVQALHEKYLIIARGNNQVLP